MASCPECNSTDQDWTMIGYVSDKFSSDFAKETLMSCDIPVVVMSHAGFLGDAGMMLNQIYSGQTAAFEISVPKDDADEASEILLLALGDKWQTKGK